MYDHAHAVTQLQIRNLATDRLALIRSDSHPLTRAEVSLRSAAEILRGRMLDCRAGLFRGGFGRTDAGAAYLSARFAAHWGALLLLTLRGHRAITEET